MYLSHQPISSMYHMPLTGIRPFWGSQSQLGVNKQNKQTKQHIFVKTKKKNQ